MKFSYDEKDKVKGMKVLVIGCGSVGSHVAVSLTRIGVRRIDLCDYDVVEEKNLKNQMFFRHHVGWLKVEAVKDIIRTGIDDKVQIEMFDSSWLEAVRLLDRIESGWYDVVVEAIDEKGEKRRLWKKLDRYEQMWVGCNGTGGLDCDVEIRMGMCGWIVGDMKSEANKDNWGVAPKVMMVAGAMAVKVIEEGIGD